MHKEVGEERRGLGLCQDIVRTFHQAFGHPVGEGMEPLTQDRVDVRATWMREEITEFEGAENIVDQADAMIDLIYFALGTLVELGVDAGPLFEIVHNANMNKRGPDGAVVRGLDGKVRKPPDWISPEAQIREAIVRDRTNYHLVYSDTVDSTAAVLAMVARMLEIDACSKEAFASVLPPSTTIGGTNEKALATPLGGGSLNRYLEPAGIAIRDDYMDSSLISEATFHSVLVESLQAYPCVSLGLDASVAYRDGVHRARFCLVARVKGERVLLVDTDPLEGGLQSANIDDVFAAIRSANDGIHRFRRTE